MLTAIHKQRPNNCTIRLGDKIGSSGFGDIHIGDMAIGSYKSQSIADRFAKGEIIPPVLSFR